MKLTKQWIERFVIGLRLCPFAHFSFYDGTLYFATSEEVEMKGCLADVMKLILTMEESGVAKISNSFLILKKELSFDFLLSLKEKADFVLENGELSGIYQTVVFHPEFQFGDEDFHASGNFTNRSPLPMIHVLRVDEVAHAMEVTADVDEIPYRNKRVLEQLKLKDISEVFADDFVDKIKPYI